MVRIKYSLVFAIVVSLFVSCEDSNPLESIYDLSLESNATIPSVTTKECENVYASSADVIGGITSFGNCSNILEYGFVIDQKENPTIEKSKKIYGEGLNEKSVIHGTIKNLDFKTQYYLRAYAMNKVGIAYGNEISFTTKSLVSTKAPTDFTTTSVKLHGVISTLIDAKEVTEYGFYWSNSTITDHNLGTKISIKTALRDTTFEYHLKNLTEGTKYYVRAYATNEKGTGYSEEVEFTTIGVVLPSTHKPTISNITPYTALLSSAVVSFGNADKLSDRGLVWSTSPNPTIESDSYYSVGALTEEQFKTGSYWHYSGSVSYIDFEYHLKNLTEGTKYYVRAYATNEKGTGYSEEVEFTTTAISAPTVTTGMMKSVWTTSAEAQYTIENTGNAEKITESGVVWSTSPNPTLENGQSKANTSSSYYSKSYMPRTFTLSISGLADSTKYYLRAYAKNEKGTGYGNVIEFTSKNN